MQEVIHEVIHDTLPMLPFLFLTYVLMEYLEHKSSEHFQQRLETAKRLGPLIGAILGIVPQCGFSVVASGLYLNHSISLGTLLAVFISTSDEAIPILIAQPKQMDILFLIIAIKVIIAVIVGYLVDILVMKQVLKEHRPLHDIHATCIAQQTDPQHGILYISCMRTVKIFVFVLIINFALSLFIYYGGEDTLKAVLVQGSYLQPLLAAIVGFIPNCAASVILSQLFLDDVLSFGALTAGLITSAGLGLLVLLRMYDNKRDIFRIFLLLFLTAAISGILLQLFLL